MQYSKSFKPLLDDNSLFRLPIESQRKIVNIISLEGTINGLRIAQKIIESTEPHRFGLKIFEKQKELTNITGNFPPEQLLKFLAENKAY